MFYVQGGVGSQSRSFQDLWQFDFTSNSWSLVNAGDSNVHRFGHSMRFSNSLNSLLLFCGVNFFTKFYTNTIYQYSFNNQSAVWTLFQVVGSLVPSERREFSTGFNPQTGEYFVFGGNNGNSAPLQFSIYSSFINCRNFLS
jgi:hypothetical protein